MDEYLSEQEQWELVKRWLRENTLWIFAGIGVAAAGLFGYNWWQERQEQSLLTAGKIYQELTTAYSENKADAVQKLAAQLNTTHSGTAYADQAQLFLASSHLANRQHVQSLEVLQKLLAGTSDAELKWIVRLRIARIQIDQGKADDALATLTAQVPEAFAARYAEVRGDALFAKGDRAGALAAYQSAQAGGETVNGPLLALKISELGRS